MSLLSKVVAVGATTVTKVTKSTTGFGKSFLDDVREDMKRLEEIESTKEDAKAKEAELLEKIAEFESKLTSAAE